MTKGKIQKGLFFRLLGCVWLHQVLFQLDLTLASGTRSGSMQRSDAQKN